MSRSVLLMKGRKVVVAPAAVLLEDFAGGSIRTTTDGTHALWQPYQAGNPDQALSLGPSYLRTSTGPSTWYTGTATGGSTTSLSDAGKDWSAVDFVVNGVPAWIEFTSGPNAGQARAIASSTASSVAWSTPLGSAVVSGHGYAITYISGVNLQFLPAGDSGGYLYPDGYLSHYVKSGTFDPACNRLSWWMRAGKDVLARDDGGEVLEWGTYHRQHADTGTFYQGNHYYHLLDPRFYANRWMKVVMTWKPQHQVAHSSGTNWPSDPENQSGYVADGWYASGVTATGGSATISAASGAFAGLAGKAVVLSTATAQPDGLLAPSAVYTIQSVGTTTATLDRAFVGSSGTYYLYAAWSLPSPSQQGFATPTHYFDGLTRFYLACQYPNLVAYGQWFNLDLDLADVHLATVAGEPDDVVSAVTCTYTGTAYELRWNSPKNTVKTFNVYSSSASMKSGGVGSGILAGTLTTDGSAYTIQRFTTGALAEQAAIYFAIQPQGGDGSYHELRMESR